LVFERHSTRFNQGASDRRREEGFWSSGRAGVPVPLAGFIFGRT
jgi:hypothetical protein